MRLIRQLFQTYIFVPWTFFIGEPLTQLPTINKTNVNFNSLSGGKRTNNRYRRSGSANQLITFKTLFIKATCWDTGLSITRPLCALSSDPLNTSVNSWTILIGKPLPNYLLLTSVTCNRSQMAIYQQHPTVLATIVIPQQGLQQPTMAEDNPLTYLQSQTTASSVAEGNTQQPARWPTPGEGSHHDSITSAYSCHHQYPSTSDGIMCVVHLGPQF